MRILVTGSRHWLDDATLCAALEQATADADSVTVVHGAARGADATAARYAAWRGWHVEAHPADWTVLGCRAGHARNAEMVNLGADLCIAAIRDHSRGATACADLAEKTGIPVQRIYDCACHPQEAS